MARKYTKRSPWWQRKDVNASAPLSQPTLSNSTNEIAAAFDEMPHFTEAACGGSSSGTGYQTGAAGMVAGYNFPYLSAGMVPFDDIGDFYSAKSAIEIATKAYFNVALVRNVINMMVDFSVSDVRLKGGSKKSRLFVSTWLKVLKMRSFMRKYFLEYYRSGNVFIYQYNGKIDPDEFNRLKTSGMIEVAASEKTPKVPIRYTILNPAQVYLQKGAMSSNGWVRMLSTFEIARLKNPQTPEDRQVFNDLPPQQKEAIKNGGAFLYIYAPLDQSRFLYSFYRKQDYEPLAVPMIFPVLPDIEWKLTLKAIDMSLSKTMELVLLHVATGRPADQFNPATSAARNIATLQQIFSSQSIGRVLITDSTTEVEWKIPDLKGLLGKDKYERVNEDIKEGLQFVFFGDEKFANGQVKLQIMAEMLNGGRDAFLDDFLQPEINKVCEAMGFRDVPTAELDKIRTQDEAIMNRLYLQMAQSALITPPELNKAIETGILPTEEEALQAQQEFKDQREDGLWQPLLGTQTGAEDGDKGGRPTGTVGTPSKKSVNTPMGQSKASENDPTLKYRFGMTAVAKNVAAMNEFYDYAKGVFAKGAKVDELNDAQASVVQMLASNLIANEGVLEVNDKKKWKAAIASYLNTPKSMKSDVESVVNDIMLTYDTDKWTALALYRSRMEKKSR